MQRSLIIKEDINKDSLLYQALLRIPWTLFQIGLDFWISVFLSVLSNFSKNPVRLVWIESSILHVWSPLISNCVPHPLPSPGWCLITLAYFQQESCLVGLARILPHLWCFFLVIFYPLTLTPTPPFCLVINSHLAMLYLELILVPYWGLLPIAIFLNEICFYHSSYCPALVYL